MAAPTPIKAPKPAGGALPEIRVTSAFAKVERPMFVLTTRWDYLLKWLKIWKIGVRSRGYAYMLAIAGVYFLFSIPALSMILLAAAAFKYQQYIHVQVRALSSSRRILWAH